MPDEKKLIPLEEWIRLTRPQEEVYSANKPQDVQNLLSSVFSKVKDHYMSFFPNDSFKTVRVKTQHESLATFRTFMRSIPQNKNRPIIIFDPTDELRIVEDTVYSDVTNMRIPVAKGDLSGVPIYNIPFMDFGKSFSAPTVLGVTFAINRYRLSTDIMMIFSSTAEQLNMYNYMVNNIRHRGKYNLTIDTDLIVEKVYMLNIAKLLKMDPLSNIFINEVNRRSKYPVRVLKYSNGMYDFIVNMPIEYYFDIPDLPSMNVYERENMSEGISRINTSIIVEVDIPNTMQLIVSKKVLTDPITSNHIEKTPTITYIPPHIEPIDIPRVYGDFLNLNTCEVVFEEDKEKEDIEYSAILDIDNDLREYILKHDKILEYLCLKVYEGGLEVPIKMNKSNFTLENIKMEKSYTVAIYANMQKINSEANARMKYIIGTLGYDDYFVKYKHGKNGKKIGERG